MNCKEHHLPELELNSGLVREALAAILHTILFIRSPGPVKPLSVHCEGFNLTYTRIADDKATVGMNTLQHDYLDKMIDESIDKFLRSLVQIGPELLSGCLTLNFFERRAQKQLFGLMTQQEKVIWEQWILHVVVNNTPKPLKNDSASIMERQRIQNTAEAMIRTALLKVFQYASGVDDDGDNEVANLDHIPPSMYEFEITCTKKKDDRENIYSRVANMPALLNLDGS